MGHNKVCRALARPFSQPPQCYKQANLCPKQPLSKYEHTQALEEYMATPKSPPHQT